MEIEHVYGLRGYLKSLYMFKRLYDEGIGLSPFYEICELASYDPYSSLEDNTTFPNFSYIIQHLFDIVEIYESYEEDVSEDKKYWLQQADKELEDKDFQSSSVIVMLDASLHPPVFTGEIGEDDFSGGKGELLKINDGLILLYDTDYGELNWADVLEALLKNWKRFSNREEIKHAVAV